MENSSSKKKRHQISQKTVPLRYVAPHDMKTIFSNHLLVNNTSSEFFLTFYEILPPLLLEDTQQELAKIESVEAKAVARLGIPADRMQGFIEALQKNYSKYLERKKE